MDEALVFEILTTLLLTFAGLSVVFTFVKLRFFDKRPWRRALTFAGLQFALAFGLVLLTLGVLESMRLSVLPTISDPDRLNFLGALLGGIAGSALAVGGAVFVESIRRRMDDDRDRSLVWAALTELTEGMVEACRQPLPEDATNIEALEARKQAILRVLDRLDDAREVLVTATTMAKIKDFHLMLAVQRVRRAIDQQRPVFDREVAIVGKYRATYGIIQTYRENVIAAAEAIMKEMPDMLVRKVLGMPAKK